MSVIAVFKKLKKSIVYFAKYSLIAAAALRPSPIGILVAFATKNSSFAAQNSPPQCFQPAVSSTILQGIR